MGGEGNHHLFGGMVAKKPITHTKRDSRFWGPRPSRQETNLLKFYGARATTRAPSLNSSSPLPSYPPGLFYRRQSRGDIGKEKTITIRILAFDRIVKHKKWVPLPLKHRDPIGEYEYIYSCHYHNPP
jgi:hypothetical protein